MSDFDDFGEFETTTPPFNQDDFGDFETTPPLQSLNTADNHRSVFDEFGQFDLTATPTITSAAPSAVTTEDGGDQKSLDDQFDFGSLDLNNTTPNQNNNNNVQVDNSNNNNGFDFMDFSTAPTSNSNSNSNNNSIEIDSFPILPTLVVVEKGMDFASPTTDGQSNAFDEFDSFTTSAPVAVASDIGSTPEVNAPDTVNNASGSIIKVELQTEDDTDSTSFATSEPVTNEPSKTENAFDEFDTFATSTPTPTVETNDTDFASFATSEPVTSEPSKTDNAFDGFDSFATSTPTPTVETNDSDFASFTSTEPIVEPVEQVEKDQTEVTENKSSLDEVDILATSDAVVEPINDDFASFTTSSDPIIEPVELVEKTEVPEIDNETTSESVVEAPVEVEKSNAFDDFDSYTTSTPPPPSTIETNDTDLASLGTSEPATSSPVQQHTEQPEIVESKSNAFDEFDSFTTSTPTPAVETNDTDFSFGTSETQEKQDKSNAFDEFDFTATSHVQAPATDTLITDTTIDEFASFASSEPIINETGNESNDDIAAHIDDEKTTEKEDDQSFKDLPTIPRPDQDTPGTSDISGVTEEKEKEEATAGSPLTEDIPPVVQNDSNDDGEDVFDFDEPQQLSMSDLSLFQVQPPVLPITPPTTTTDQDDNNFGEFDQEAPTIPVLDGITESPSSVGGKSRPIVLSEVEMPVFEEETTDLQEVTNQFDDVQLAETKPPVDAFDTDPINDDFGEEEGEDFGDFGDFKGDAAQPSSSTTANNDFDDFGDFNDTNPDGDDDGFGDFGDFSATTTTTTQADISTPPTQQSPSQSRSVDASPPQFSAPLTKTGFEQVRASMVKLLSQQNYFIDLTIDQNQEVKSQSLEDILKESSFDKSLYQKTEATAFIAPPSPFSFKNSQIEKQFISSLHLNPGSLELIQKAEQEKNTQPLKPISTNQPTFVPTPITTKNISPLIATNNNNNNNNDSSLDFIDNLNSEPTINKKINLGTAEPSTLLGVDSPKHVGISPFNEVMAKIPDLTFMLSTTLRIPSKSNKGLNPTAPLKLNNDVL
eukprot:gene14248-16816_t